MIWCVITPKCSSSTARSCICCASTLRTSISSVAAASQSLLMTGQREGSDQSVRRRLEAALLHARIWIRLWSARRIRASSSRNLSRARKSSLLIYDPEVADPAIIRLLQERSKAGVEIRILGRVSRKSAKLEVKKLFMRLHTRMIVRDGEDAFLGSQSLRTAELDARREVGLIFHEPKIILFDRDI